jgi:site-specific DNA-methyltransferase (adenine-specific)
MIPRVSNRISDAHKSKYIFTNRGSEQTSLAQISVDSRKYDANWKNPGSVLKVNSLRPNSKEKVKHPTQKPVALFEYLIKTYTNEGETVLDNCMGSGTTAVACINTNRNYIGIEKELKYFEIAKKRIESVTAVQMELKGV